MRSPELYTIPDQRYFIVSIHGGPHPVANYAIAQLAENVIEELNRTLGREEFVLEFLFCLDGRANFHKIVTYYRDEPPLVEWRYGGAPRQ